MNIQYTCCGDYLIPVFAINMETDSIGKYGRMRLRHLQENRPDLYQRIVLSGQFHAHLTEIDRTCHERLDRMIRQMAEAEGVDEQLKAENQLGWVGRMNNIKARAEEIVLNEIVYA